ncbi:MAG TPA: ABC transporter ATP-binding protein [Enterovirga sp.]
MIRLEGVSKTFPGAPRPAVDGIDLEVPEGETCVLIGPSGCGKTTTLRMVNRLIEPSAGRILLAGEDVLGLDPVRLRRGIGYVIQSVGLFPHMSVGENVAAVPKLLGWPKKRVSSRVDEMLDLVGLDPAQFARRRPATLSGGQRQRVGVARALAADPPALLMDEPFGAVDPIARGRLQTEVLAILRRLRKTVILVTHDLDEASHMGDRVAVMRDGRIAQCDRPDRLLLQPKDAFVEDFVGSDRALRRLTLVTAGEVCEPTPAPDGSPTIPAGASLRAALAALLASGSEVLRVDREDGLPGSLSLDAIRQHARALPNGPQ